MLPPSTGLRNRAFLCSFPHGKNPCATGREARLKSTRINCSNSSGSRASSAASAPVWPTHPKSSANRADCPPSHLRKQEAAGSDQSSKEDAVRKSESDVKEECQLTNSPPSTEPRTIFSERHSLFFLVLPSYFCLETMPYLFLKDTHSLLRWIVILACSLGAGAGLERILRARGMDPERSDGGIGLHISPKSAASSRTHPLRA